MWRSDEGDPCFGHYTLPPESITGHPPIRWGDLVYIEQLVVEFRHQIELAAHLARPPESRERVGWRRMAAIASPSPKSLDEVTVLEISLRMRLMRSMTEVT